MALFTLKQSNFFPESKVHGNDSSSYLSGAKFTVNHLTDTDKQGRQTNTTQRKQTAQNISKQN